MNKIPKILILIWLLSIPAFTLSFINVYKKNKPIITNELLKIGEYKFSIKTSSDICIGVIKYNFNKESDSTLLMKSNVSLNLKIKDEIPVNIKSLISFNPFLQLGSSSFAVTTKDVKISGKSEGINKLNYILKITKGKKEIYKKKGFLEGPIELQEIKDDEYQVKSSGFISSVPNNLALFDKLFKISIVPYEDQCRKGSLEVPIKLLGNINLTNFL